MQQPETRALWQAVALLVLLSAARWGWSMRPDSGVPAGKDVLPELLATSREAAAEVARRARPLDEGERLDPNRMPEAELDRLPGVGPATARAIVATRENGVVFRRPEDLLAVPGIGVATLARIRPALDLDAPPPSAGVSRAEAARAPGADRRGGRRPYAEARSNPARGRPVALRPPLDVNRATVEELQSLPGIGPALAERIVAAREEQMFISLDDLVRVRGIGEATIERLRPLAVAIPFPGEGRR
jgi:competence protein ComEA